jgi:RNA polymerase sigma-70 factor, ECF subfamily
MATSRRKTRSTGEARPVRDDDELIPALILGDQRAFAEMLDAWSPSLKRLARAYVRSEALADEVVQETWKAVITGLPRFERRSSLKTWVFTILANRARTRAVRESRTVPMSALGGGGPSDEAPAMDPDRFASGGGWLRPPSSWEVDSPESLLLAKEGAAVIERVLTAIPPMQRAVVVLRDVEGITSEDACNLLGISESNQRVLLHRGRSKLRAALAAHLDGEDEPTEE